MIRRTQQRGAGARYLREERSGTRGATEPPLCQWDRPRPSLLEVLCGSHRCDPEPCNNQRRLRFIPPPRLSLFIIILFIFHFFPFFVVAFFVFFLLHYMFGKQDKMDVRCSTETEANRVSKNGHKEGKDSKGAEGNISTSFLKEQQGTFSASAATEDCNKSKSGSADPDYCRRILVRGTSPGCSARWGRCAALTLPYFGRSASLCPGLGPGTAPGGAALPRCGGGAPERRGASRRSSPLRSAAARGIRPAAARSAPSAPRGGRAGCGAVPVRPRSASPERGCGCSHPARSQRGDDEGLCVLLHSGGLFLSFLSGPK